MFNRSSSEDKSAFRSGSPAFASIPRASSRQSRPSSRNKLSKQTELNTTSSATRSGTETPTIPVLNQERVTNSPSNGPGGKVAIQEGLGSLNRWSQSTVSSKGSPNHTSHRRGGSSRMSNSNDYGSISGRASPPRNLTSHLPQQSALANHHDPLQGYHLSERSITPSHAESSVLDLPDIDGSSKFSTGVIDMASKRPNIEMLETAPISASLFQNNRAKPGVPEMKTVEYAAVNNSGNPSLEVYHHRFQEDEVSEEYSEARRRGQSQKAMLSKALQKANTAVLLDNAANFEGAMEAYSDACQLLQLVMLRSNGGEDEKLKLQEIRDTYMIRVTELQHMDFSSQEVDSKALPERPLSQESFGDMLQPLEDEQGIYSGENTGHFHRSSIIYDRPIASRTLPPDQIPPRRQSLLPSALDDDSRYGSMSLAFNRQHNRSESGSSWRASGNGPLVTAMPQQGGQVPEVLDLKEAHLAHPHNSELSLLSTHARDIYESTSWLDTIDESGASSPSSTHSKMSSVYLRQRRSRRFSHGTEAEFDAALDAAVEAAYDEGLEPAMELDEQSTDDDVVANARRNVELAKQKVREAEREAEVAMTRGREIRRMHEQAMVHNSNDFESDYLDDEAEEEERLLEEMTRGYVMDDFEFDLQSKSAIPRQSDSSTFSGRTWESSAASHTTAGAALSPLAEDAVLLAIEPEIEQSAVPSTEHAVVSPNVPPVLPNPGPESTAAVGVRARRMSGQNATELKIETSPRIQAGSDNHGQEQSSDSPSFRPPPLPKYEPQTSAITSTNKTTDQALALRSAPYSSKRNVSIGSLAEETPTTPGLERVMTQEEGANATVSKMLSPERAISKVPSPSDQADKPVSGPKVFQPRNASISTPDLSANAPDTPSTSAFPSLDLHKGTIARSVPVLATPTGANFAPNGLSSGGLYLFDNHIHSPTSPGTPNSMAANAPVPLEACPESFLLRPFWLMRCIYQTIAHPRGGYLSTKLFIPRDVWRVKNVKLKAVEEKVSNCDLLTAALLKLAKVDMYDADAILEEMQSLESVLDQVQIALSKKIGSEVGVQGALPLFKSPQGSDDTTTHGDISSSKASNGSSKSYLSSWRKLRSKNSGLGAVPPPSNSKETGKDNLTISSLPMTSIPTSQPAMRDIMQLQFNGPNANYMSALARLCDAAQVLDQIAQQVEDPGLKHSSPTLVGLELSTRHAAEFFGFYVCRFALNDLGLMLDKFIKRGSEWVLI